MGLVPPITGFLKGLRDITLKSKTILIFDEVMTGFRVAFGGAQELYGIKPDLTTLGKIIGGGMPVGVYGGKAELMNQVAPEGPVYQAGTLSGNPVAMAAGMATLKKLSCPGVYEELEMASSFVEEGINAAIKRTGVDAVFQRVGSMATLFFRKSPVTNYSDAKTSVTKLFARFFWSMAQKGVYLPPSQFESWFFSTALNRDHLKKIVKAVGESLKEIL